MNSELTANATTQPTVWYQNVLNSVTQLGTAYLTLEQQRQLNQINVQRAAANLPPLNAAEYTAGFNVGVGQSTQNTAIFIVGLLVGGYVLGKILG